MTISVFVNSYNYAAFIGQALDSVFDQTLAADEVVIVDDGSTDGSCAIIQSYADRYPQIKFIRKENGGQLSSFNAGIKAVTGDLVFFLDSDDAWKPEYLERITAIYRSQSTDFVFCALQNFGVEDGLRRTYKRSIDLGFTAALTYFMKVYIGGQTSSLSARRTLLDKIYPVPFENDWRVSADFSLVAGASLAGARKYYCAEPLVYYRMHPINAHKTEKQKTEYLYKTAYHRNAMINYFMSQFSLTAATCSLLLDREIATRQDPMPSKFYSRYQRTIFLTDRNLLWKIAMSVKLLWLNVKLARTSP